MSIDFQRMVSEKAGSHDDLIKVIKINHNFSLMFGNECIVQASFGYFKRRSKSLAGILWYKEIQQSKFDYYKENGSSWLTCQRKSFSKRLHTAKLTLPSSWPAYLQIGSL